MVLLKTSFQRPGRSPLVRQLFPIFYSLFFRLALFGSPPYLGGMVENVNLTASAAMPGTTTATTVPIAEIDLPLSGIDPVATAIVTVVLFVLALFKKKKKTAKK